MIVVNLSDGLGNQLFQIAFGYSISQQYSKPLYITGDIHPIFSKINTDSFIRIKFNTLNSNEVINFNRNSSKYNFKNFKLTKYQTYHEKEFSFNDINFNLKNPTLFKGFWQSEKYFYHISNQIRFLFSVTPVLDNISRLYLKQISITNSVAIHIRRGDYISIPENFEKHGVCSIDYYKKAIKHISSKVKNLRLFVFTDDHDWVQENILPHFKNILIVSTRNFGANSWRDLYLISQCKHQIIANSTFSWWGAWLNTNRNKLVVAPQNWFTLSELNDKTVDLIPPTWIRL